MFEWKVALWMPKICNKVMFHWRFMQLGGDLITCHAVLCYITLHCVALQNRVYFPYLLFWNRMKNSRGKWNIPVISVIRYAHCCSSYSDFLICHRALVKRLLSQGYKVSRLSNTFKKFYGRHTDLVGQYKKNVCQMFADSIS